MLNPMGTETFWKLDLGNVLTIVALLIAFWGAHASNVRHIKSDTRRMEKMETKLDVIYQWFMSKIRNAGKIE